MKLHLTSDDALYDARLMAVEPPQRRGIELGNKEADGDYLDFVYQLFTKSAEESLNDRGLDDHDPQYKFFLSHLKPHGKSYVLDFTEDDGSHKFIEYEKEEQTDRSCDLAVMRNLKNVMTASPKRLSSVPQRKRSEPETGRHVKIGHSTFGFLGNKDFRSHKHIKRNSPQRVEPKRDIDGSGKELPTKSQTIENIPLFEETDINEKDTYLFEEDYLRFLKSIEFEADKVTLPVENGKELVYETLDSRRILFERALRGEVKSWKRRSSGVQNASVEEEDSCQCLDGPETDSEFRKKVMTILRKPFDHQEYAKLWHDVTERKETTRNRELRHGRDKPCGTNVEGKSYLEYFRDLNREIEAVPYSEEKRLNILRGFFFWLQHLTQEGAFKPWQDSSCRKVKPECC